MAKRMDERRFIALSVMAFGTDVNGQYFREPVCTLDLSANGARISNFRRNVSVGQQMILQFKTHKVPFRVIWCGEKSKATEGQIGLQATESLKKISDLNDFFNGNYVDTWMGNGRNQKPISLVNEE